MAKPTLAGHLVAHLIGFLVCVAAPAALTAMAPASWIKFQRQGDHVIARADTCVFFIIPYRTLIVDPVTELSDRTKTGSITRHRRSGTDKYTQAETEGFLSITGPNGGGDVSVTPHNLEDVLTKSQDFLKNPQANELKLFVVANWKFSVIAGGLMSLLTALWVVGVAGALVMFVLRALGLAKPAKAPNQTGLP